MVSKSIMASWKCRVWTIPKHLDKEPGANPMSLHNGTPRMTATPCPAELVLQVSHRVALFVQTSWNKWAKGSSHWGTNGWICPSFQCFQYSNIEKKPSIPWDFSPFIIIIRTETPNMACIQQTTLLCGSPNCRHWNVNSPALCCSPGQEHHEAHPLFGPGKLVHLEKFESDHSNFSSKKMMIQVLRPSNSLSVASKIAIVWPKISSEIQQGLRSKACAGSAHRFASQVHCMEPWVKNMINNQRLIIVYYRWLIYQLYSYSEFISFTISFYVGLINHLENWLVYSSIWQFYGNQCSRWSWNFHLSVFLGAVSLCWRPMMARLRTRSTGYTWPNYPGFVWHFFRSHLPGFLNQSHWQFYLLKYDANDATDYVFWQHLPNSVQPICGKPM